MKAAVVGVTSIAPLREIEVQFFGEPDTLPRICDSIAINFGTRADWPRNIVDDPAADCSQRSTIPISVVQNGSESASGRSRELALEDGCGYSRRALILNPSLLLKAGLRTIQLAGRTTRYDDTG